MSLYFLISNLHHIPIACNIAGRISSSNEIDMDEAFEQVLEPVGPGGVHIGMGSMGTA